MFAGHVGLALAAKRARPEVPLWLLVLAAQGCDWGDVVFADLLGFRNHPLWTHSLPAVAAGALLVAGAGLAFTRWRTVGALLAALYASHLLVDYLTGLKPTWPGGPWIGLELYDRPAWDFALEAALATGGWALYRGSLPPKARRRPLASLLLAILLAAQLLADVAFAIRGPM